MSLLLAGYGTGLAAVAAGALAPRRARVGVAGALSALAAVLVGVAAVRVLAGGAAVHGTFSGALPFTTVRLRLDALGAAFTTTVALVVAAASLFSIGYSRGPSASRTAVALQSLFALTLIVVPVTGDVTSFLTVWETMALASLALLLVDHDRPAARAAALWYATMTQAGAAAITLGLLVVSARAHSTSLLAPASSHLGAGALGAVAFCLTAAGFASKAGAVPLHVWLPRAHPEAATPVSAMMSGAMTALGLYGLTRVDLALLSGLARGWWIGLLVVGAGSALFGALHAVASTDLKRLLAYSTIDVMGVGLTALGAAGALRPLDGVAATLVVGVLVLVAAHGAFKALLFLAAGLVERASGTRDLDLLGGLARGMGCTTALVAVAVASAVGIPLGAGFVGEWLVVEGLVGALGRSGAEGVVLALVALVAVALTSGLTAVAMVKLLGIGFLGRPRGEGARHASERLGITTLALAVLAIATVAVGAVPGPFVAALSRAAGVVLGTPAGAPRGSVASVSLGAVATTLHPLALVVGAAAATAAVVGLARLGSRTVRSAVAWACGRAELSPRMQYTATSFAEPLQRVFADVLRPDVDLVVSHEEESREVERVLAYQSRVDDAVERGLFRPLVRAVDAIGRRARWIASGGVHRYLAYGFAALLVVLVVVR